MGWFSFNLLSSTRRTSTLRLSVPRSVGKGPPRPRPAASSPWLSHHHHQQCCYISSTRTAIFSYPSSSNELLESSSYDAKKATMMEIVIISKENIKPATPTPLHLKTYKVSVLDQLFPHIYIPMVFFYPNNHTAVSIKDERSQRLKLSLSQTLARFYPFAGKIKDDRHIECNDEGVYYVEAQINNRLSNFLAQPNDQFIHRLLPYDPNSVDSISENYLVMIQVNFFNCGGIAITMCASHKIIDGHTYVKFFKAWAATSIGSLEQVYPSFIAPSFFPQNPLFPEGSSLVMGPSVFKRCKFVTRRFVFDGSALVALKAKASTSSLDASSPSRVVALATLIWKCATAASRAGNGSERPSILSLAVNLRSKTLPPLPEYSVGNLLWSTVSQWMPNAELNLHSMMGHLQNAIAKINSDFVEEIKGEEGSLKFSEQLKEFGKVYSNCGADYFAVTSLCNIGLYEADFGWGKPKWVCIGNPSSNSPLLQNLTFLMDSRLGNGIEAWVTLSEEDMAIFERDPEILSFASVNPSPL